MLSATRLEWVPKVQSDLYVVQTPIHLSDEHMRNLQKLIQSGQPVALVGSFSDGIDKSLLRLAGVNGSAAVSGGQIRLCKSTNRAPKLVQNAQENCDTFCYPWNGSASSESKVVYSDDGSPALILNMNHGMRIAFWNPPDLRSMEGVPLSQVWGNTGAPYALAAGVFNEMLQINSALHVSKIDLKQTMNIAAWRTQEGKLRILAGNLEEGLRDDADFTRSATLAIPESWQAGSEWKDAWTGRKFGTEGGMLHIELPQAASVLLEPSR